MWSAGPASPQTTQQKSSRQGRFLRETCPQRGHACPLGLVGDELTEFVEWPEGQGGPLVPREPYPVTDPLEVFQGDPATGALGIGHHRLSDLMVHVRGVPGLPPGSPLELAFG